MSTKLLPSSSSQSQFSSTTQVKSTGSTNVRSSSSSLFKMSSLPIFVGLRDHHSHSHHYSQNRSASFNDNHGDDGTSSPIMQLSNSVDSSAPFSFLSNSFAIQTNGELKSANSLPNLANLQQSGIDPNSLSLTSVTGTSGNGARTENRRRKNSNMKVVLPDLEALSILQQKELETEQVLDFHCTQTVNRIDLDEIVAIAADICSPSLSKSSRSPITLAGDLEKSCHFAFDLNDGGHDSSSDDNRPPLLSQCDSFGSEKESAAAWLAAAVSNVSPKLARKSNSLNGPGPGSGQQQPTQSNYNRKCSNPLILVNGNCFNYVNNNNNGQLNGDGGAIASTTTTTTTNIAVNQNNNNTSANTSNSNSYIFKNKLTLDGTSSTAPTSTTTTKIPINGHILQSAPSVGRDQCNNNTVNLKVSSSIIDVTTTSPSLIDITKTTTAAAAAASTSANPILTNFYATTSTTTNIAISSTSISSNFKSSPSFIQTSTTTTSSSSSSTPVQPTDPTKVVNFCENLQKCPIITTTTNTISAQLNPPKLLQPFGNQGDRVRRTSILRSSAPLVGYDGLCEQKKNVRFADSMGMQLESVRYFVNPNAQLKRRFSSNNPPTFITNFNSPWNVGGQIYGGGSTANNNGGNRTDLNKATADSGNDPKSSMSLVNNSGLTMTNYGQMLTPSTPITRSSSFSIAADSCYRAANSKLSSRYELVAINFASPSLQFNFENRLKQQSVLLHSLTTAETTVYGVVAVTNLHFIKRVTVRYTFNDWTSFIERDGTYMLGSHSNNTDKFSFVIYARPDDFQRSSTELSTQQLIPGANQDGATNTSTTTTATTDQNNNNNNNNKENFFYQKWGTWPRNHPLSLAQNLPTTAQNNNNNGRLYFAVRYVTGDEREFWDNNDGRNYCLNLKAY